MDIRAGSFDFPRTGDSGPQSANATITFPRAVLRATAGMAGYSAAFDGEDHHLGRLTVELASEIDPGDATRVFVTGTFGLRDWSGEWDDDYSGSIAYVVLADLVPISPPFPGAPRGDLAIVDAEISQVIQHFRSGEHLNAPNVFPDNSIRLVAGKPTVVRLYTDYDASSGLAPIATLSGMLDVVRGGVTTTLGPLATITPRRDAQTERRLREHTLLFIIPETESVGDVVIRARVFDAADNTQFSQVFERTLVFDELPALPVMGVAINYTGPDVRDGATPASLAAPSMADFVSTLALTEKLFPIPQVNLTSLVTMDYDEEVTSNIGEGCDKLGDLLDDVREMRGDADDIVLGLFGTGLDTGSVGGCGGGGAAVGRVFSGGTTAHELAHAVGRQHAPCDNVTRCATPANTDDDYPVYSGFDSDSIGEFGVDPVTGSIKDPADAHDIMGYSPNRWISPYTYKALMSRIPASFASSPARGEEDLGDWIKIKQPVLFLRLDIERGNKVVLAPSFQYPAYPQPRGELPTPYVVEQRDAAGRVLKHACLSAEAHGGPCDARHDDHHRMWPVRIRQGIDFDPTAKRLIIYDGEQRIYEQPIEAAPAVVLKVGDDPAAPRERLLLRWSASGRDCSDEHIWYLVQWRDARGTWRGLAPRTQVSTLAVPKALFGNQQTYAIRVLASTGLATGVALWESAPPIPAVP